MPDHHLPGELLVAYAAGTASEAHALLCAVHLTLCPTCRADLALLEEVAGALLESGDPVEPRAASSVGLVSTATGAAGGGQPALELPEGSESWPRPLYAYVRGQRWHWDSPGVHVLTTELYLDEMPVRLYRLAKGHHVPKHTHDGQELSLVLSGGFVDLGEHYLRGDVSCRDATNIHDLIIDDDSECVTLVVNEHPLVPLTMAGKLHSLVRRA